MRGAGRESVVAAGFFTRDRVVAWWRRLCLCGGWGRWAVASVLLFSAQSGARRRWRRFVSEVGLGVVAASVSSQEARGRTAAAAVPVASSRE